ncbi:hypothetical protein NPIL_237411 [Nephila pilipes]|uniref:Uncharacterized protein n=1 Tax=Nephila pilipes TaxID=299642 RepID=A0A8X6Q2Y9_NEPPI|nr:hypothetical protein NPIL_237411 [Nephila pilipes]
MSSIGRGGESDRSRDGYEPSNSSEGFSFAPPSRKKKLLDRYLVESIPPPPFCSVFWTTPSTRKNKEFASKPIRKNTTYADVCNPDNENQENPENQEKPIRNIPTQENQKSESFTFLEAVKEIQDLFRAFPTLLESYFFIKNYQQKPSRKLSQAHNQSEASILSETPATTNRKPSYHQTFARLSLTHFNDSEYKEPALPYKNTNLEFKAYQG